METSEIADTLVRDYGTTVTYTAGGSGQNVIRGTQWFLPPGSTVYFGCIGRDDRAQTLERIVHEEDGVCASYQRVDEDQTPTGSCATLLTNGGAARSLVAHLSAATRFSVAHLKANHGLIEAASIYYVTGFMIPVSIDSALYLAQHASMRQKLFVMNLSAPFVSQFYLEPLMKAYAYADIVFGNNLEAAQFNDSMKLVASDAPIEDIVLHMASLPFHNSATRKRLVIITQGHLPTIVSDGTTVRSFPVKGKIAEQDIIDTNGAGDSFAAGFLAVLAQFTLLRQGTCCSLSENDWLELAVDKGHDLAGLIIRTSGIVFPKDPNHPIRQLPCA